MSETTPYTPPLSNLEEELSEKSETYYEHQPLSPKNLIRLFFKPRKYFNKSIIIQSKFSTLSVIYIFGIVNALERIDQNLMKADLGTRYSGMEFITSSWMGYWIFVLGVGVLSALFTWYIAGWWYKVRLSWSGVENPDPVEARIVYVYSSFVYTLPTLLFSIVQSFFFANYLEAWQSDAMISGLLLLLFPIWSCFTSYFGVESKFNAKGLAAKMWFLILPLLLYAAAIGLIIFLYWKLGY